MFDIPEECGVSTTHIEHATAGVKPLTKKRPNRRVNNEADVSNWCYLVFVRNSFR